MRILSWNVNGLRSIYKKGFVPWVEQVQPDILCIQETKASPEQLKQDLTEISGYRSYFASAVKKGYSGVALYTQHAPDEVHYGIGSERFDQEGRMIIAHYQNFILYNVYFPNGKASAERLKFKMEFYDAFLEHVQRQKEFGKGLIICGDVNTAHTEIDLARPKANEKVSGFLPEERAWIDKFLASGYVDTFRVFTKEGGHYTWWDLKSGARQRNVGWRIDYFYVSSDVAKRVKTACILPAVMGSDHCPIGIELLE
jgi:exodeoxyribonuclease-3